SFSESGNNKQLIVIDPVNLQKWSAPLSSLSIDLQEQLSSTNMQFHQNKDFLYITGGYGYSATLGNHTTYGKLTAIDVPNTIKAIINAASFTSFFRQISDTIFSVTGGHLNKINETYYLAGGQKFIGRYNPMGPDHGPGFFQQYTDQVRKFTISDNGIKISIKNYQTITDNLAFHRRDYNVVPQILPNGKEGLTLFSGVFQTIANIPFLNSVTISSDAYKINPNFAQYYNHYHCAVLPMYSKMNNEMHNIFFGGISQYYDSAGVMVQNSEVPFVKTIATVIVDKSGKLSEYKLPIEMPSLSGAGSEFIPLPSIPHYENDVIKLDSIRANKTLLGHIYGGITSTAPNIFWTNSGKESIANNQIFKVYLIKNIESSIGKKNSQSINGLQMQVYANRAYLSILFSLTQISPVELKITDADGKEIANEILKDVTIGNNTIHKNIKSLNAGKTYWVTLKTGSILATQKINIEL
ncbi:MAG: T9SS type A sorting domain-containing protein, partial [Bacteroidia bacterium]